MEPWKITNWPTILPSTKDTARRADAGSKRKHNRAVKVSAPVLAKSISDSAATEGPSTRGRALRQSLRVKRVASPSPAASDSISSITIPSRLPEVVSSLRSMTSLSMFGRDGTHYDGLFFQDLGYYEGLVADPSRSSTSLATGLLQLQVALERERSALETLGKLVSGRAEIGVRLETRFQEELARLGGNAGDDPSVTAELVEKMHVDGDEDSASDGGKGGEADAAMGGGLE